MIKIRNFSSLIIRRQQAAAQSSDRLLVLLCGLSAADAEMIRYSHGSRIQFVSHASVSTRDVIHASLPPNATNAHNARTDNIASIFAFCFCVACVKARKQ